MRQCAGCTGGGYGAGSEEWCEVQCAGQGVAEFRQWPTDAGKADVGLRRKTVRGK